MFNGTLDVFVKEREVSVVFKNYLQGLEAK